MDIYSHSKTGLQFHHWNFIKRHIALLSLKTGRSLRSSFYVSKLPCGFLSEKPSVERHLEQTVPFGWTLQTTRTRSQCIGIFAKDAALAS